MRPYTARVMRHRERQDTIRQELKDALWELRQLRRKRDSGGVIFQMEGEPTLLAIAPAGYDADATNQHTQQGD